MIPHPITETVSLELAFAGAIKAGFPSPAEEVREKLDLVKLLVQHSASTFFFQVDGTSMVDVDMDEGDLIGCPQNLVGLRFWFRRLGMPYICEPGRRKTTVLIQTVHSPG